MNCNTNQKIQKSSEVRNVAVNRPVLIGRSNNKLVSCVFKQNYKENMYLKGCLGVRRITQV